MMLSGRKPIRVVVVDDAELVRAGVAKMLEPHADRVLLVDLRETDEPVDVVLRGDGADIADLTAPYRQLVAYSWRAGTGRPELSMELGAEELVAALEAIADPAVVWPTTTDEELGAERWPGRDEGLSSRESEVVGFIAAGLTNDQVAAKAFLSINTVKSYIRSAYRKMGVRSRSQAVLWAIDHGFGDRPSPLRSVG